jgi:hypothetical protein
MLLTQCTDGCSPGVYHLQDPRSRVYNFDPYLEKIMPMTEFAFDALKEYTISSKDKSLSSIATKHGYRYYSSTSSLTSVLQHFHYQISAWRPPSYSMLSKGFAVSGPADKIPKFAPFQHSPFSVFLRYRDGVYAIDSDKTHDTGNNLTMAGKMMEKLLTSSKETFETFRKMPLNGEYTAKRDISPETFHYTGTGSMLVRSQLDGQDRRLPGSGVFDIKTRAVLPVRMDAKGKMGNGSNYEIRSTLGDFESFEREYYDMIRSALLKYSLQVRLGRMEGIFVAYHNLSRMFGFQYIPIEEMDYAIHGTKHRALGDQELNLSLHLLEKSLDKVIERFPKQVSSERQVMRSDLLLTSLLQSLRVQFDTRKRGVTPHMHVFAEPFTEEQIDKVQNIGGKRVEAFEIATLKEQMLVVDGLKSDLENDEGSSLDPTTVRRMLSALQAKSIELLEDAEVYEQLDKNVGEPEHPLSARKAALDSLMAKTEDLIADFTDLDLAMTLKDFEDDELMQQIGRVKETAHSQAANNRAHLNALVLLNPEYKPKSRELIALTIYTRNVINGERITEPPTLSRPNDRWELEYTMDEIEPERADRAYQDSLDRQRNATFIGRSETKNEHFYNTPFWKMLARYSDRGAKWREQRDALDKKMGPRVVLDHAKPKDEGKVSGKGEGVKDVDEYLEWLYGTLKQ